MENSFNIEDFQKRKKKGNLRENIPMPKRDKPGVEMSLGFSGRVEQIKEVDEENTINQEQYKEGIKIEVVSKREDIIKNETDRILWYLKNYERYEKLGYSDILNLPLSINPKNYTIEDVEKIVQEDYFKNQNNYETYAKELVETWNIMSEKMATAIKDLYGFSPSKNFTLAPTNYGTGGGSLEKDGIIFFKMPKNRLLERNTAERITHEILTHGVTASLREGTEIDESISTSHQWYKERLMDLLGRTLLVRAGILKREEVKMDGDIEKQVASIVDPIYYSNPEISDENDLRYNGRLRDLFKAVIEKIKIDDIQSSEKI